jgi:hypothetical protein
MGLIIVTPPNLAISFAVFVGYAMDKRSQKRLILLIWNTIMWMMRKNRNEGVFSNKETNIGFGGFFNKS